MSSFEGSSSSSPPRPPPNESAFPDEDEDTITMSDFIEMENKLDEETTAVLGNSDEKNCTYSKGYISRQAIYSCATCSEGSDNPAAICLACALECHDNHDVYELYTKRNYRCDCGNSKFKPGFECKLMDKQIKKLPLNECNKYNHNFSGKYCICDKRYPPDAADDSPESNDAMLQCIVCEDWYHTRHLGADEVPAKFEELICKQCVEKLDFVRYYRELDLKNEQKSSKQNDTNPSGSEQKVQEGNESGSQKEENNTKETRDNSSAQSDSEGTEAACEESDTNDSQVENKNPQDDDDDDDDDDKVDAINSKSECILDELKHTYETRLASMDGAKLNSTKIGPLFWDDCQWRAKLCRCPRCLDMYKAKECEYLLDEKDTVQYYEAQGKAIAKNRESPLERGMSALNRMNRVAVLEAINGYQELKADLSDYLKRFADSNKVVREEDIHEFFQQLKTKKRARLDY